MRNTYTRMLSDAPDRGIDFDFGTDMKETFEDYIIRVEGVMDQYLAVRGKMSDQLLDVIINIFADIVFNHQGVKFPAIYHMLKIHFKREPMVSDLHWLVDSVRNRLQHKIDNYGKNVGEGEKRLLSE